MGRSIGSSKSRRMLLLALMLVFLAVAEAAAGHRSPAIHGLARSKFPKGFLFGAATSAYQVEGAVREDGRLPSIWDTFAHNSGKIADNSTGDVATDHYHRFKEDIDMLKYIGMDTFRFSIAWPRIFPKGSPRHGPVNQAGIDHYNKIINYAISKGLIPMVTIFHWDVPQVIEDEYGGWRNMKMIADYLAFAEVCFREFGDRVKLWSTMNEPLIYTYSGYDTGASAPGRCSAPFGKCPAGNSSTEPYIVVHHILIAHAEVVHLYRTKYGPHQHGQIGIVLVSMWAVPYRLSDAAAAQRVIDFRFGWFLDPLTRGDYPTVMRQLVGDRLPRFTPAESATLRGSFDFIGLNYYSTDFAVDTTAQTHGLTDYVEDARANLSSRIGGRLLGTAEGSPVFVSYPRGLRATLDYLRTRYGNPPVYITETGYIDSDNGSFPLSVELNDTGRVRYHQEHLANVLIAIREGCNVKAYTVWALLDNFEWGSGYSVRFGLVYVDFKNNLRRYARASALWFKSFLSH